MTSSNVVPFPVRADREWASVDRELCLQLSDIGLTALGIERVRDEMKRYFQATEGGLEFAVQDIPGSDAQRLVIAEAVSISLSEALQRFKSRLFIERLRREVDWARETGF